MSSQLKNILVVGASGSVGKIILDAFVDLPQFNVSILTRSSSKAIFPAGFTVHKSDYSEADLVTVFKGQDVIISVVGISGFGEQKKFIDAAVSTGVKRFIPSEFSGNTLSPTVLQLLPVFGPKKEVLDYLKEKETSGLTWTAIWLALLLDWGLESGLSGYDLATRTATIWDDGNTVFTLTNTGQLGRAVIAVLERPDQTANKNLYIASVETSQNEILGALEKPPEQNGLLGTLQRTKKGDFTGLYTLGLATSFGKLPGLRANYVRDEESANELLGLEMESVKGTVARVISKPSQAP